MYFLLWIKNKKSENCATNWAFVQTEFWRTDSSGTPDDYKEQILASDNWAQILANNSWASNNQVGGRENLWSEMQQGQQVPGEPVH